MHLRVRGLGWPLWVESWSWPRLERAYDHFPLWLSSPLLSLQVSVVSAGSLSDVQGKASPGHLACVRRQLLTTPTPNARSLRTKLMQLKQL